MLVQELPEARAQVLQALLRELELAELPQVASLSGAELLQELLAILEQAGHLGPDGVALRRREVALHLGGDEPLHGPADVGNLPALFLDLDLRQADLAHPAVPLGLDRHRRGVTPGQEPALVRKTVPLLDQHLANRLAQPGHLQLLARALKILLQLPESGLACLAQDVDLLRLRRQRRQLLARRGVGLGEPADDRMLRLRGLLRPGRLLHGQGRRAPTHLGHQVFHLAEPVAGRGQLTGHLIPARG